MLISIVTPSLNCGQYILRNITSVREQKFNPNELEHWIIDGGSRDQTIEILRNQKDVKWVSEPDNGLSDAVNKGIRLSQGDWIIWLNADDELAPGAIAAFLSARQRWPEALIFVGAQKIFSYDGTLEGVEKAWDYRISELLGSHTAINQASTFVHRSVYEKVGLLDTTFTHAMDYEWMVRAALQFKCQPIDNVLTHYHRRRGSIMDSGMVHQHRAYLRVRRMHGKPWWELADLQFRFYVATDWLRKMPRVRALVRWIKQNIFHIRVSPTGAS